MGIIFLVIFLILILSTLSAQSSAKDFSAEVLGSKNISGLDAIQFLIKSGNVSAYNVSITLEGGKNVEIISNKTFFEFINASSVFDVAFPFFVSNKTEGEENLTLQIEYYIYQNSTGPVLERQTFNFTFNAIPPSTPRIKVIGEEVYPGKNFRIFLTNEGGLARNVTITGNFYPKLAIIPVLPSKMTVPLTFYYPNSEEILILNLSYEYFDGGWKKGEESQRILLRFEDKAKGVLSLPAEVEVKKGRGNLTLYIFNPYLYPIDLTLESEIFRQKIPVGWLNPGESKVLTLEFETDERFGLEGNVESVERKVEITGLLTILSPVPRKESFSRELLLKTIIEPKFEVWAKNNLLPNEEQILEVSIKNIGRDARNVRVILEPAFGIAVKTREALIDKIRSGEEKTLKFEVSVGDLPPQSYAIQALIAFGESEKSAIFAVNVLPGKPSFDDFSHLAILIAILILAILAKKIR